MMEALHEAAITRGRPFLGTCIGMQLLAGSSLEMGTHQGFGWVPGQVVKIAPATGRGVAVANGATLWPPAGRPWWIPHYGWNDLRLRSEEHTSELQSLMRSSYAVFCLKKKKKE